MADMEQVIRAVFKAEVGPMAKALDALNGRFGLLEQKQRAAERATQSLARTFGTLKNIAIGGGLAYLLKGLVGVASQTETTQIGLATLLQSADRAKGVGTSFSTAMGTASETLAALRKEAAETPGTFAQVAAAFQTVAMQGRMAGASVQDLTHLAGNMATIDSMLFGGQGVVARDVQQLLRGEAGDVATPQLAPEKQAIARLAKKNQAAALARMTTLLEVDPAARAASGKSFDGMLSTAKDKLSQIAEIAGRPLMARLNEALADMLGWLDKNKATVEDIAKKIGTGLADAVSFVGKAVAWLADHPIAAAALAVTTIVDKFVSLGPILTALATNPLFLAIGAAAAAVAGIEDFLSKNGADQRSSAVHGAEMLAAGDMGPMGMAARLFLSTDMYGQEKVAIAANQVAAAGAAGSAMSAADKITWAQNHPNAPLLWGTPGHRSGGVHGKYIAPSGVSLYDFDPAMVPIKAWRSQPRGKVEPKGDMNVNVANARINVNQRIDTNDPGELAGATLVSAFRSLTNRVLRPEMAAPTGRPR